MLLDYKTNETREKMSLFNFDFVFRENTNEKKRHLVSQLCCLKPNIIHRLNDYRSVAVTAVVIKAFGRLVLAHLKELRDPLT